MKKKLSQPMEDKSQKSQSKRPYGCPCGKYYLSYPALFTHVKQKHGGNAPGQLIKPESGKIRGRPKSKPTVNEPEIEENLQKIIDSVNQLIEEVDIEYNNKFEISKGNSTCQDAASIFLEQFLPMGEQKCQIIICFLDELRETIETKHGIEYWTTGKPGQIIQISNQMFVNHQNMIDRFPLPEQALIELIFNFFEWLYIKKWTDHRLMRRQKDEL